MLSSKIKDYLNCQDYFNVKINDVMGLVAFSSPLKEGGSASFTLEKIKGDDSLLKSLAYEVSAFSFETVGNLYTSPEKGINISSYEEDFKDIYKRMCMLLKELEEIRQ